MIDRAEQIFQFLPMKYSSVSDEEYVSYWWNAYTKNFEEENYHVAFLAFHILYMTAVYFLLYKVSKIHRLVYEHSLFHMGNEEERHYLGINSAFSFVEMGETSVFRFLKVAGADQSLIGDVSRFCKERNNAAHARGVIFFKNDPGSLEKKAVEYVKALEKIQNLLIGDSVKVSQSWKVSQMDEAAMRLYLESEILVNNLNPTEVNAIALSEKPKRAQLSKLLTNLVAEVSE